MMMIIIQYRFSGPKFFYLNFILFYFYFFIVKLLLRFIVKNFIVKKFIVKIYCAIIINLKIYTLYYYNPKTGKGKKKFSNLKAN